LDLIVKEGKWEAEDVFESDIHNYCTPNKAEVTDCVIYYISGFVCRSLAASLFHVSLISRILASVQEVHHPS